VRLPALLSSFVSEVHNVYELLLSTQQTSEKSVQITLSLQSAHMKQRLSLTAWSRQWCRFTAVCTAYQFLIFKFELGYYSDNRLIDICVTSLV